MLRLGLLTAVLTSVGCSDYYWLQRQSSSVAALAALGPSGGAGGTTAGGGGEPDLGGDIGSAISAVRTTRLAFAVRGMSCTVCHAQFDSSVVTDFGLDANYTNFNPANAPAFDVDTVYGNRDGSSWQSVQINGTLYVPKWTLPASAAKMVFGVNAASSLKSLIIGAAVGGPAGPISGGVTAPSGQDAVVERKTVTISYPTDSEILALLPDGANPMTYVGPTRNAAAGSAITGISLDSRNVARNGAHVRCVGDIVVAPVLFLKNLSLDTDAKGCRLYTRASVFLQGPIQYVNGGAGEHLQISSARAIVMGFSATRLGATSATDATRVSADASAAFNGAPGGPFIRLSRAIDYRYAPNPSYSAPRLAMLDQIVADSVAVGADLLDAGDSSQFSSLPAGASVDSSGRMVVPYQRLLLNAPHVHSRYGGVFKGIVIAEVAIFPLGGTRFAYDPTFDTVPAILPALSRSVFALSPD